MIPPERYSSLGELLYDALLQYKTETALLELSRKRTAKELTYLQVKREAERMAQRFAAAGIGAGGRVAIVMSNQAAWPIAALATFLRGGVLVPIDYKLDGPDQETLIRHSGATVLVTEYGEWREMKAVRAGELPLERVFVTETSPREELPANHVAWEVGEGEPLEEPALPLVRRERSDVATIVYSSGTGGSPKGCMLTHDNYLEQYRTLLQLFPYEPGDRFFSVLPSNHAIDFMSGFVGAFACGSTVVHQRSLRPELIRWVLQEQGITHIALVPLILEAFERRLDEKLEERSTAAQAAVEGLRQLNAALTLDKPRAWLSDRLMKPVRDGLGPDLKMVFCGGAFVDPRRARRFYELGVPVAIGYGLTEAGTVLTVNDMKPFRADSVGAPIDGVEMEIRDPDGAGIGEVWVRGRTVFAGYLDDPEQTAEALVDGWLRTGDRGFLDPSGHLHLVGRSKNMIVTAGGKNIYPEDIESAFEGLDCEELVVFATGYVWPGTELTGSDLSKEKLVAVVRPKGDGGSLELSLLEELRKRNRGLPDFKRIWGVLPWKDEFPRTASMKVKRAALAEELRAGTGHEALVEVSA
ncbi:MAG: hypothetical protein CMN30_18525 [Sandaracinus sp.]|nr:hypothetical protein [Sandaracinus sp.]